MDTWKRLALGLAAVVFAIALGAGAYAMTSSDDPGGDIPAATSDKDHPGATDAESADTRPADGEDPGLGVSAVCAEGVPDCVDMVDVPYGDFGEYKCAADVDCTEPAGCPPDSCIVETCIEPMPGEVVDPVLADGFPTATTEELKEGEIRREEIAAEGGAEGCAPEPCVPGPATTCLAPDCPVAADGALDCGQPLPDPCADPATTCRPPDCAVSSDGEVSCPDPAPPCEGGPAVDCMVDPGCVANDEHGAVICPGEDGSPPSAGGGTSAGPVEP